MTHNAIGKTGFVKVGSLMVEVMIEDVRASYGRTDYKVSPLKGSGFQWVNAKRVNGLSPKEVASEHNLCPNCGYEGPCNTCPECVKPTVEVLP